ncbi:MAG: anthranilate synthase component I, partial [Pseudorhodoplanes sp.]
MTVEPAAEEFAARYETGAPQVVWTRLVADLETPVSAFLKIAGDRPPCFLFESVEGGAVRGRYSIIGLAPDLIFRVRNGAAEIDRCALSGTSSFSPCPHAPLDALRALIAESRIA